MSAASLPLLIARDLECRRGRRRLFQGISLGVEAGRALLVTGRNGSGKTTLLRTLCGLTRPESGDITWRGQSIRSCRDEYNADLLYLGHANALKDDLTAEENLANAMCIGGGEAAGDARRALADLGLEACARLPAKSLSQGQRRRVALARLWLSRSRPLWVLDEPFVALDVESTENLRKLLESHLDGGGALVFTTHQEINIAPDRLQHLLLGA
jgi:heme exporter protein A